MKKYEKVYEDVFTAKRILKNIEIHRATNDLGLSMEEFAEAVYETWRETSRHLWEDSVRIEWLTRQFKYKVKKQSGVRHTKVKRKRANGNRATIQWGIFYKNFAGVDISVIRKTFFSHAIGIYIKDLYQDFEKKNPFSNPDYFKYPFEHVTLDHMILVYQMEDKMELLQEAENNKMTFAAFADYVINFVGCHNEELGKEQYKLIKVYGKAPLYFKNTMKTWGKISL